MLALVEKTESETKKDPKETPDTMHGRLLEAVHISGYSMGRACKDLSWLLDMGRWKTVGKGFEDIDDFLKTIDLSDFKITIEQRKPLAKRLADLRASQRATGKMMGVDHKTIANDLADGENSPKRKAQDKEKQEDSGSVGELSPDSKPHVSQNTGDNEWYTPLEYIAAVRAVMGDIDLDPASSDIANETVGASTYYTLDDDGLKNIWRGRVFLNPPYAQPLISQFCQKLSDVIILGDVTEAIALVNNATETAWFRMLIDRASAVVFAEGRVRFLDPQGKPGAPLQGQAFIYCGDNPEGFLNEFRKFGWGALL